MRSEARRESGLPLSEVSSCLASVRSVVESGNHGSSFMSVAKHLHWILGIVDDGDVIPGPMRTEEDEVSNSRST